MVARRENTLDKTTHGLCKTRTYKSWASLNERCGNENAPNYYLYGERGIRVCSGFRQFEIFLSIVGERPERTSIDRKDTNGHYSCGQCEECVANSWPMNCKWSTAKEQQRNRNCNSIATLHGVTRLLIEWSEILNINFTTLDERRRRGWSDERMLTTPLMTISRRKSKSSAPPDHTPDSNDIAESRSQKSLESFFE